MNKGLLFEFKIVEILRLLFISMGINVNIEINGGFSNGMDIKIRGNNCKINIECKLNEKAIGDQVAITISPKSNKIRGISKRSKSTKVLQSFINDFLSRNNLMNKSREEILNKTYYVTENLTKLHYQEKMENSPGKNIIIVGNSAYLLNDYSPVFRRIRFRKKGNGITTVIENGPNKTSGQPVCKVIRSLFT